METYKVGYGKPPREHQFKKGVCPNPAGRGKRKQETIGSVARGMLDIPQGVPLRGRVVQMSRQELILRGLVRSAANGDVGSANQILDLIDQAERLEDIGPIIINISGGLPSDEDPE